MRLDRVFAAFFISVFLCPVTAQTGSFQIEDQLRDYILHVPSGISNPPLVINMHGMGSNASQQRAYTQLDKIADREKFIVVYPNGIGNAWDLTGNTDVNFLSALIDTIYAKHRIDRSRVYSTGMSMGGYMSHKLACQLAGKIAAIAPVAGLNAQNSFCSPSRPVPVMQIHGTVDNVVAYGGVAATIEGWVKRNGCPRQPQVTEPYPSGKTGSAVKKEYYGPCNQNSEVILLTVKEAGHIWPGGLGATSDINAGEEAWAFLKRFSLPSTGAGWGAEPRNSPRVAHFDNDVVRFVGARQIRGVRITDLLGRTVAAMHDPAPVEDLREVSLRLPATGSGVYVLTLETSGPAASARLLNTGARR